MPPGSRKFAWFKTIHACCFTALQLKRSDVIDHRDLAKFVERTGFKLTLKNDLDTTLEDIEETDDALRHARDVAIHKKIKPSEAFAAMGLDVPDKLQAFLREYESFKASIGKWDFGDMLAQYDGTPIPDIDIVFIDEAQDLSKRQWEIALSMFSNAREIIVAGDDDQSIYGFMGAEEYAFLDLRADEEVVLDYSFRVPAVIGAKAERIINRVAKRKPKSIRWKPERGELRYFGGEVADLPFAHFLGAGKSVMVLVPHVKQAHAVRHMLEERGFTSAFKGTALTTRTEAINVHTYFTLKKGESVTPARAAQLMRALGYKKDEVERVKGLARDPSVRIDALQLEDINFEHPDWPEYFGARERKTPLYRRLRAILNKSGLDAIGHAPKIDISTYHGSKGREADIVVLVADCFRSFHEDCQNRAPHIYRLCYVGLTRAKERAIIIEPKTNRYLTPLME
jgi:superfamily I DNA/RNA helicase